MELEGLIERIRREEVALVIGSGLSLYAGYMSVNDLTNTIREKAKIYCTDLSERNTYGEKSLEDISEILIRLTGNRNELNEIILKEFGKKPITTHTHDQLSRIPHFEHIFTTNYDTLIEDSMAKRCHVIGCESAFPSQSKNFPKIYKLHGDINNLNNIVITRRDYAKSIATQTGNLIWNRFEDIVSSKDILFIGHSNEDSNLWMILEKLDNKLKTTKRKRFFVSPNILGHQRATLEQNGFNCFILNADQFLNILYPKLVETAVADLEKDILSSDTFQRFLALNDKSAIINSKDAKLRVDAIMERDGKVDARVNFSIKKDVYRSFTNFNKGDGRKRSFKFVTDDLLDFEFSMGGYKFPLDKDGLSKLEILLTPEDKTLEIESDDGEIELSNIPVKQYSFADGFDLDLAIYDSVFIFSFKFERNNFSSKFQVKLPASFSSVKNAMGCIGFIHAIAAGKRFKFFFKDGPSIPIQITRTVGVKFGIWDSATIVSYFANLRSIEKKMNVRFQDIFQEDISPETVEQVHYLCEILKEGFVEKTLEKTILLPSEIVRRGVRVSDKTIDNVVTLILEDGNNYNIHGIELPVLYFAIDVLDPEFVYNDEVCGVKSKTKRTKHRLLSQKDYENFQNLPKTVISVADIVSATEKD